MRKKILQKATKISGLKGKKDLELIFFSFNIFVYF